MMYKDDDPDNLGGLGGMLPAEVLKMLNELLEQMHLLENEKIEKLNNERKIEIVIVQSGGQHVETQVNIGNPLPTPHEREGSLRCKGDLPEVLATEKAMALWEKARAAGYVDDNYQPLISRTQAALLADAIAERLGIREKWKVFETLWNRKNMYRDYYKALNLQQSLAFQDEIKKLFR